MNVLLAPWRYAYVTGQIPKTGGCPFCELDPQDCLHLGRTCALVMNAYPYATGHLMVVPLRHVGDLCDLTASEGEEFFDLQRRGIGALRRAFGCQGVNVGINLGKAAGAGVAEHLHCHLVPRWLGDVNFMGMTAQTAVVPMTVEQALEKLRAVWQ